MTRVFSGIQPTGRKHLGNYIGAIRHYFADQALGEAFYCVVDLHASHVPRTRPAARGDAGPRRPCWPPASTPRSARCSCRATCPSTPFGLDPGVHATYGELRRMTQFKEKARRPDFSTAGLFAYPALMAADILLYEADRVPVGDDQRQHLELARDVARGSTAATARPSSCPRRPSRRPARGDGPAGPDGQDVEVADAQGTVLVLDPPDVVRKIPAAVTDPGTRCAAATRKDRRRQPHGDPVGRRRARASSRSSGASTAKGYGTFKGAVAEAVVAMLDPIRERYTELRADESHLRTTLRAGAPSRLGRWRHPPSRPSSSAWASTCQTRDRARGLTLYDLTDATPSPVFIVGAARSGTTLVRSMLGAHPELAIPPESHFLGYLGHRYARRSWTQGIVSSVAADVARDAHFRGWGLDPGGAAARVVASQPGSLAETLGGFFSVYADAEGKRLWGDKTPHYVFILDQLRDL